MKANELRELARNYVNGVIDVYTFADAAAMELPEILAVIEAADNYIQTFDSAAFPAEILRERRTELRNALAVLNREPA
jgi:hypothetical protein